jgi:hypothetical protein
MALTRLLFQLRSFLDSLLRQRINTMTTAFPYGFLVPSNEPDNQAALVSVLAQALGVSLGDIELTARCSANGNAPETHRGCGIPLTADQSDALSTWVSPGGEGYDDLGVRCRRLFFEALETTDPAEAASSGKTLVTLVEVGQGVPQGVPLEDLRFTFGKLLEENSLVRIEDAI